MLHGLGRCDDRNALVLRQLHQMWVSGYHEIDLGGDGACEHRVVGVIDDCRWDDCRDNYRGQGGVTLKDLNRSQPASLKVLGECLAGEHTVQLSEQRSAGAEIRAPDYSASISFPGWPCQRRPETAALVSRTSRTTDFRAVGVDLGLDLLGCHGRKGVSRQHVTRLDEVLDSPGKQRLAHHPFECASGDGRVISEGNNRAPHPGRPLIGAG